MKSENDPDEIFIPDDRADIWNGSLAEIVSYGRELRATDFIVSPSGRRLTQKSSVLGWAPKKWPDFFVMRLPNDRLVQYCRKGWNIDGSAMIYGVPQMNEIGEKNPESRRWVKVHVLDD